MRYDQRFCHRTWLGGVQAACKASQSHVVPHTTPRSNQLHAKSRKSMNAKQRVPKGKRDYNSSYPFSFKGKQAAVWSRVLWGAQGWEQLHQSELPHQQKGWRSTAQPTAQPALLEAKSSH